MFENFQSFMDKHVAPLCGVIAAQKHLKAIRDGIVSCLPFILLGSFFMLIANPPVASWKAAVAPYSQMLYIPFRLTLGAISLYVAFGIGYSLAKSYKMDPMSGGLIAFGSFMMTQVPLNVAGEMKTMLDKVDFGKAESMFNAFGASAGYVLKVDTLGSKDMFTSILISLLAVEVLRWCKNRNITIKMPPGVPDSVERAFAILIPVAITLGPIYVVRSVLGVDYTYYAMIIFEPLVRAGNTLPGALVPTFLNDLLWWTGLHGNSVIATVTRPIYTMMLEQNGQAHTAGLPLPFFMPGEAFTWFVWIGGCGGMLGVNIIMLFSKIRYLKDVGRAAIIPSLCNISEPMLFGLPIVLNPIMFFPFVFAPLVTATITYICLSTGLVGIPFIKPPWNLPWFIGDFLATADWKAPVLGTINLIITTLIYYPFYKVYERQMQKQEQEAIDAANPGGAQ